MTDAKDVRETLRERARDARVVLMDAHPTMSYEDAAVVALLNVATEQIDTLTRERDEAVKRRREIDDEAFDYAEQIETLKTQLASARELMEFARIELGGEERDGSEHTHWCVACDDHVDGNHVVRNMLDAALTAALTQEDA